MIQIGKTQTLTVCDITATGAHLSDKKGDSASLILPYPQMPDGCKAGDPLTVFVYSDHYGKAMASMKTPSCEVGEIAYLKVIENNRNGAFLDWGFVVDLFAPRDNIFYPLQAGKSYLFRVFVNKEGKIRATTDIYDKLRSDSPYSINEAINGVVYKKLQNGALLVAIDNKYYGLIPKTEIYRPLDYGSRVEGRVIRIREDGKIDMSLRQRLADQMDTDAEMLLSKITANGGSLNVTDNSSPEEIKRMFSISKKAFKRAVGRLLKENRIRQSDSQLILLKGKKNGPKKRS